jgi:hypothetical protein
MMVKTIDKSRNLTIRFSGCIIYKLTKKTIKRRFKNGSVYAK